jgi:polyhydroxyalkanoate synthesis repressor PhaR
MVVKKYGNRRLYDTEQSSYITLEELADRVRGGEHVTVVDAKSGKDLTQQTLAHIILESRGAAKLLPIPLLEQLIRMGDDALAEFFGAYVSSALELYVQARQGAQAMVPYNPFAQIPFAATNAFARMFGGWGPSPPPQQPPRPAPEPKKKRKAEPDTASQVAELRRELEELKAALKKGGD